MDISPLKGNASWELGIRARNEGWGQEGGALRRNGPIFGLAWFVGENPKGEPVNMSEAELLTVLELAAHENAEKKRKAEREARLKPTGLHFIFVNPSEPPRPDFWNPYHPWYGIKNFFRGWLQVLSFWLGRETRWGQRFDPHSGYAVCLTEEAIRREEECWIPNGFTTFRVSFMLDERATKGSLSSEEQHALRFLAQTCKNIEDCMANEDSDSKAPDGYLHFRQWDLLGLHLKGIKAERMWREWLRGGKKGPSVIDAT